MRGGIVPELCHLSRDQQLITPDFNVVGFPIKDQVFTLISLKIPHRVEADILKVEGGGIYNQLFSLLQKTFYKRLVLVAPCCSSFLQLCWQLSSL